MWLHLMPTLHSLETLRFFENDRVNLDVLFVTDFINAKVKTDLKSFKLASSTG